MAIIISSKNHEKSFNQEIINIGSAPVINGIGNFVKNKKVGISGLNDGTLLEKMFNELAVRKGIKVIGDIKMPLVISTVDIAEAKEYIFTNCAQRDNPYDNYITEVGIGKAVRASSSFPAFFCPCEYKNHIFMDGGVLDNTPVLPLKQVYNKKIIAVNFEADPVEKDSDVMDIIMKTLDIMGNKIAEKGLEKSDLILTVPTDRAGLFDIEKLDKCYKFGYDMGYIDGQENRDYNGTLPAGPNTASFSYDYMTVGGSSGDTLININNTCKVHM